MILLQIERKLKENFEERRRENKEQRYRGIGKEIMLL